MTPAYDLPTSHPYGDTTMALTLNGRRREDIGRADFVALGGAVGLRARAVQRVLDELSERIDLWIDELIALPFDDRVLHRLRKAIEYRRDRFAAS